MSKHPAVPNIHYVGRSRANHGGLLSLAALLVGGLTVPASAQNKTVAQVAPESHFTVPPGVRTPVVLRTEPDAACDLHATGVNDPSYTMRLYANIEGYVRFHFAPNQGVLDAYLQLDCTTPQAVTTHPLHLRIDASPTGDMPAPLATVPVPAGSKTRPALTAEVARQLSDEDIIAQGFPPRPNAAESPEAYARWFARVSRPMTIVPAHATHRTDISHLPRTIVAGPNTSANWSGFAAQSTAGSYRMVGGDWSVPSVTGELEIISDPTPIIIPGPETYSALWVGLDGNTTDDLVQAGTEQDARSMLLFGAVTNYYAWTEVYPLESITEAFSVSPGDEMYVTVYVGDSKGNVNPSGNYAWFNVFDETLGLGENISTKLGSGFGFTGNSAEWIMERPYITALGGYPDLANYGTCEMTSASVLTATGTTSISYSSAQNQQITMYEKYDLQPDNNELSTVGAVSGHASWMQFSWKTFH